MDVRQCTVQLVFRSGIYLAAVDAKDEIRLRDPEKGWVSGAHLHPSVQATIRQVCQPVNLEWPYQGQNTRKP